MSVWYCVLGGKREGPFTVEQIREMATARPFPSDTLVWTEGMANWLSLAETPLAQSLSSAIAPPSLPTSVPLQVMGDAGTAAAVGFIDAIKVCFGKYATFQGRASRAEYWWFTLFVVLTSLLVWIPILGPLLLLAVIVPHIAVAVRRLHDTDRSGWWWFIQLIPLIGAIMLIIYLCQRGTEGQNRYG